MTVIKSVSYMVVDIIDSSLLMQEDQRRAIGLYETFETLLVPVIEKAGGYAIEYVGDSISAGYCTMDAATDAGFVIQDVLAQWNSAISGSEKHFQLKVRIGIYSIPETVDVHQHQLALAAATCLQSLGSESALCIAAEQVLHIKRDYETYSYTRGKHDLGFLSDATEVFYLYKKQPGFIRRLSLKAVDAKKLSSLWYEKNTHGSSILDFKNRVSLTGVRGMLAVVLVSIALYSSLAFFFSTPSVEEKNIIFSSTENYAGSAFDRSTNRLSQSLVVAIANTRSLKLATHSVDDSPIEISFPSAVDDVKKHNTARLKVSIQHSSGKVRLSWILMDRERVTVLAGGSMTAKQEQLIVLEQQFTQSLMAQLETIEI